MPQIERTVFACLDGCWSLVRPDVLCHRLSLPNYLFLFSSFLSTFASKSLLKKKRARKKRRRGGALLRLTCSFNFSFPRPATSTQGGYLAETQRGGTKTDKKIQDWTTEERRRKKGAVGSGWRKLGWKTPWTHTQSPSSSVRSSFSLLHCVKLHCVSPYCFLRVSLESKELVSEEEKQHINMEKKMFLISRRSQRYF